MVKTLPGRKTTGWIDDQERTHLKEIRRFTTNHSSLHFLKLGMGSPCPWLVLKSLRMPRAQYCSCRAVFFAEIRFKLLDFNYFLKYLRSFRCSALRCFPFWRGLSNFNYYLEFWCSQKPTNLSDINYKQP